MKIVEEFADKIVNKIATGDRTLIEVKGTPDPYRWYYQPRDRQGNPVDIRKVKPLTNEKCTDCKICAKVCPMGSISFENVREIPGICIKCCACIKSVRKMQNIMKMKDIYTINMNWKRNISEERSRNILFNW